MKNVLVAALVSLLFIHAVPAHGATPSRGLPHGARIQLAHPDEDEDPRIGTYESSTWGFSTRSYWIEGPDGLVLVDTQFLPSAAEEFVTWAERVTGKKARLAVVLHANPDKFNGTAVMQKRGIKVVTSRQVAELLPAVHDKRLKAFGKRYAPDYPREVPRPEVFGDRTTVLKAAGLELTAHVVGAGVSEAHVVLQWEGHVFAGDLLASGTHGWLEIGKGDAWLDRLAEIRALEPDRVYPGRGAAGDLRVVAAQELYLRDVMGAMAALQPAGDPDEGALERARSTIEARYPAHRFAVFLDMGLPAEWRRQAAANR